MGQYYSQLTEGERNQFYALLQAKISMVDMLGGDIEIRNDSQITFYGSDFLLGGQSVSGTLDLDHLTSVGALTLNTDEFFNWYGHLNGVLSNGTPLSVDIVIRHLRPISGGSDTANITLVP